MKDGKIFTPTKIINKMLDDIDFNSKFIGKKILEPASGDGNFLVEIVKRTIKYSNSLKEDLENIYAWELTQEDVDKSVKRLNKIVSINIDWKIECADSLKKTDKNFDLIIGNPPYIKIQDLDEDTRKYIQSNFSFCSSGSTDIYLSFFELCFNKLNENGTLIFITPNSFLTTKAANTMREKLLPHFYKIENFGTEKVFDGISTYTAISYIKKKITNNFIYIADNKNIIIDKKMLLGKPFWSFSKQNENNIPLKEIINIHTGIATLLDKVYIFTETKEVNNSFFVKSRIFNSFVEVEKDIIKKIIKGSKLKYGEIINENILWPYKNNGSVIKESEMILSFPKTYKYLLSVKEKLAERDKGKGNYIEWYAFGRSQGLVDSIGPKIFFSPMGLKPNFIYNQEDATIYSGYYFKYNGNIDKLLKVLNSNEMKEYIKHSGRDFGSGWKSYTKTIVDEFRIDTGLL